MTGQAEANEGHMLAEALPALAQELRELLARNGHHDLAEQVAGLRIVDRDRSDDDYCAMIYTVAPLQGAWGRGHENIALDPASGIIVLDVVSGRISAIEVLYRPEVREQLLALLP